MKQDPDVFFPPDPTTEERLLRELAYCKARLTDIENAPPGSRHREGRSRVLRQIRECEELLASVRHRSSRGRRWPAPRGRGRTTH